MGFLSSEPKLLPNPPPVDLIFTGREADLYRGVWG